MSQLIEWKREVTNRSQSDVFRIKALLEKGWISMDDSERTEWLSGMKGSLNRSDLERIENNVQLLSDVLELDLTTYFDEIPDIPTQTYFSTLLSNVESIRNAYSIHQTTPVTPEAPVNSFEKINAIEQILADVHGILLNNFSYYCGTEIYSGELTGMLL